MINGLLSQVAGAPDIIEVIIRTAPQGWPYVALVLIFFFAKWARPHVDESLKLWRENAAARVKAIQNMDARMHEHELLDVQRHEALKATLAQEAKTTRHDLNDSLSAPLGTIERKVDRANETLAELKGRGNGHGGNGK